jgi:coenzyme F420-reducing hydrogenase delta subunit
MSDEHTAKLEAKRVDMTHAVIYGANGMIVARMAAHECAFDGACELAHRYNAHEQLLAALQAVVDQEFMTAHSEETRMKDMADIARAALKSAAVSAS